jgi:hypothetical protein
MDRIKFQPNCHGNTREEPHDLKEEFLSENMNSPQFFVEVMESFKS